ncbi:MAG: metal ABC transporter substrate-binding protein [Elusimicrobiota bacterium]|jgi:zinc transport system substrate-binding protein|nr:metal ABC transporter substrate-binding protein [Elusimicrobiota bacterium]
MKKIVIVFIIIAVVFVLFVCLSKKPIISNPAENKKIKVVSAIFPPYDFVREIAGDKVNLQMLLKPGAETHSYEPTPQDILKIQNSNIFIYTGGESDEWVEKILSSMDTKDKTIMSMMSLVQAVQEETVEGMQEEDDEESGEIEYDEHVWTSISNAKKITSAISQKLQNLDPDNADFYKKNTQNYLAKLDALDNEFKDIVSKSKRKTMVFGDRFPFRYFADEYGLRYFAAFRGCSTDTQASPATIAFLINKMRTEKIPVVFHIEMSDEKIADAIAESAKAKKALLHSAHNINKWDFENKVSFVDLMKRNAQNLKEALW